MPNVLVAPCYGNPRAREHYHDTLEGWVRFTDDKLWPLLDPVTQDALLALHPSGSAHFWGATDSHDRTMPRLRRGDVVLFTGNKQVMLCGEVGFRFINKAFADALWWKAGDKKSFVHAYSLLNVRPVGRPASELASLCDYAPNHAFPGQLFLKSEHADKVLRAFELSTSVAEAQLEEELAQRLAALPGTKVTPVEKARKKNGTRTTVGGTTVTERVESVLVEAYQQFRASEQLAAFTTGNGLRADLYREAGEEVEVIEAKSLATHGKVREAVAQLLDYAMHSPKPVTRLVALFPQRPQRDSLAYLHRLGIDCEFLAEGGSFVREPAPEARREYMIPVWRGL